MVLGHERFLRLGILSALSSSKTAQRAWSISLAVISSSTKETKFQIVCILSSVFGKLIFSSLISQSTSRFAATRTEAINALLHTAIMISWSAHNEFRLWINRPFFNSFFSSLKYSSCSQRLAYNSASSRAGSASGSSRLVQKRS